MGRGLGLHNCLQPGRHPGIPFPPDPNFQEALEITQGSLPAAWNSVHREAQPPQSQKQGLAVLTAHSGDWGASAESTAPRAHAPFMVSASATLA